MKKLLLTLASVLLCLGFASARTWTIDFNKAFAAGEMLTDVSMTSSDGQTQDVTFTYDNCKYYNSQSGAALFITKPGNFKCTLPFAVSKIDYTQAKGASGSTKVAIKIGDETAVAATTCAANATTSFTIPEANQVANKEITFDVTNKNSQVIKIVFSEVEGSGPVAPSVKAPSIACTDNVVTITNNEEGATVYYTTDGSVPTAESTEYKAPFEITADCTVKAIAVKGADVSSVASMSCSYIGVYEGFAAFQEAAGGSDLTGTVQGPLTVIYQNGQNLYLQDAKGANMLVYGNSAPKNLTNGTTFASLTGKFTLYSSYIPEITNYTLGTQGTGTAVEPTVATAADFDNVPVYTYVVLKGVNITAVSGQDVTISDGTNTLAGRDKFRLNFKVTDNCNVTGFADIFRNNGSDVHQLAIVSVEGGEVLEQVATPTFSVAAGEVEANTDVEILCATEGASIYYTTDGSVPSATNGTPYLSPIVITEMTVINAIAVKDGMADSEVATAEYTLKVAGEESDSFDFSNVEAANALIVPAPETAPAANNTTASSAKDLSNSLVGYTWVSGNVNVWIEKVSGNNYSRWWYTDASKMDAPEVRVYSGNTLNIGLNKDGYRLSEVVFSVNADSKGNSLDMSKCTVTAQLNGADVADPGTWTSGTGTWVYTAPKARTSTSNYCTNLKLAATGTNKFQKITVKYVAAEGITGVDDIAADNADAPAEYYNLQGVRVMNPAAGQLYIVRQGNKVTKQLVR